MSNALLEAALSYAGRGWPVLPLHSWIGRCTCGDGQCSSPAKHPRTAHGLRDATVDQATIRDWWVHWPDSNVGVRCDQLFVLDLDGPQAVDALRAHDLDPDLHPCTARTGAGRHLLFQGVPGGRPRTRVLPDVDVRAGEGSYIVAAPSIHWTSALYEWVAEGPPPALPSTIRALLGLGEAEPRSSNLGDPGPSANGHHDPAERKADERVQAVLQGAPVGTRHDWVGRLAGRFARLGMTEPETLAWLQAWNRTNQVPLEGPELARYVHDVFAGDRRQHGDRSIPDDEGGAVDDLVDIDELRTLKPVAWAIDGLVPIGLNVVYAEPNVGKSLLLQSWMFASAANQDWLDRRTRAGSSILLVGEGRRGLWKRVAAWDQASPGSKRGHPIKVGNLPDLSDASERRKLEERVAKHRPTWLGIDTLVDATGNADENSSTEMKLILLFLSRLAEAYDVAVVLIHHANKDQMKQGFNRVRGTTAIVGKAEAVFSLQASPLGGVALICEKQRDDEKARTIGLRLLTLELQGGGRGVVLVPDAERTAAAGGTSEAILSLLEVAGSAGFTVAQLVSELHLHQSTIYRALTAMVASLLVTERTVNKVNGTKRYWLTKYAPMIRSDEI